MHQCKNTENITTFKTLMSHEFALVVKRQINWLYGMIKVFLSY